MGRNGAPDAKRRAVAPPSGRKLGAPLVSSPLVSRVQSRASAAGGGGGGAGGATDMQGGRAFSADPYLLKRIASPFSSMNTSPDNTRRPFSARNPIARGGLSIPSMANRQGASTAMLDEEGPSWIRITPTVAGAGDARPVSASARMAGRREVHSGRAGGGMMGAGGKVRPSTAKAKLQRLESSGTGPRPSSSSTARARPATASAAQQGHGNGGNTPSFGRAMSSHASTILQDQPRSRVKIPKEPSHIAGRRMMRHLEGAEEEQWRKFKKVVRKRENYGDFGEWIEEVEGNLLGKTIKQQGAWDLTGHFVVSSETEQEQERIKDEQRLRKKEEEEKYYAELQEAYKEVVEREKVVLHNIKYWDEIESEDEDEGGDDSDGSDDDDEKDDDLDRRFVDFYKKSGMCDHLGKEQIVELSAKTEKKAFRDGQDIILQGDSFSAQFWVIYEGSADAYWTDPETDERHHVARLSEGAVFGLSEFPSCPHLVEGFNANIVARGAMLALCVQRTLFVADIDEPGPGHGRPISPLPGFKEIVLESLDIGDGAELRERLKVSTVNGDNALSPQSSVSSVSSYTTEGSLSQSRSGGKSASKSRKSDDSKVGGGLKVDVPPELNTDKVVTWGALDQKLAKADVQGKTSSTRLKAANAFAAIGNVSGKFNHSFGRSFGRSVSSNDGLSSAEQDENRERYTPDPRDLKTLWVVNQEVQDMLAQSLVTDEGGAEDDSLPIGYLGCFDATECKATIVRSSSWSSDTFEVPRSDRYQVEHRRFATIYNHDEIMWRRPVLPHGGDYETHSWRKSIGATNINNTVEEILECLGRCRIFQRMDRKQRARLVPHLDYLLFEPGQSAIGQGTREGLFMFVIFEGAVEAHKHKHGSKVHLRHMRPPAYFGELSIMRRQPRSANVTATEQSKIICINIQTLLVAQLFEQTRDELKIIRETFKVSALRTLFDSYDMDNDGMLAKSEMFKLIRTLGFDYTDAEFEKGFAVMHKKFEDEVDFDDFEDFWDGASCVDPLGVRAREAKASTKKRVDERGMAPGDKQEQEMAEMLAAQEENLEDELAQNLLDLQVRAAEEARSFWRTYDMDGSGTLDSHELLAMLIDLGFEDCTPERVEKEMRLMDTQDKGEVELEDFTDWWIMLQSNLFTDEQQRVALPLEAAKAIMIHHPAIELEPCRCDELFDKIDMDGDTLVDYEDLFRAVTNRRRNGDVLSNALAVELGFAEEEGQAFDMEEFRAGWNILDTLEQGRIDIDQFRGYYAKDSKSHREKDGDENDGEARDEAPSPMEVWAARTDPGSFAIHEASFRSSAAPITDTAVIQFRRGITDSRGTFINSPHAKTPKENDSQHGAFRGKDLITLADSFKGSFRAPSRGSSFLFRATSSAQATTPRNGQESITNSQMVKATEKAHSKKVAQQGNQISSLLQQSIDDVMAEEREAGLGSGLEPEEAPKKTGAGLLRFQKAARKARRLFSVQNIVVVQSKKQALWAKLTLKKTRNRLLARHSASADNSAKSLRNMSSDEETPKHGALVRKSSLKQVSTPERRRGQQKSPHYAGSPTRSASSPTRQSPVTSTSPQRSPIARAGLRGGAGSFRTREFAPESEYEFDSPLATIPGSPIAPSRTASDSEAVSPIIKAKPFTRLSSDFSLASSQANVQSASSVVGTAATDQDSGRGVLDDIGDEGIFFKAPAKSRKAQTGADGASSGQMKGGAADEAVHKGTESGGAANDAKEGDGNVSELEAGAGAGVDDTSVKWLPSPQTARRRSINYGQNIERDESIRLLLASPSEVPAMASPVLSLRSAMIDVASSSRQGSPANSLRTAMVDGDASSRQRAPERRSQSDGSTPPADSPEPEQELSSFITDFQRLSLLGGGGSGILSGIHAESVPPVTKKDGAGAVQGKEVANEAAVRTTSSPHNRNMHGAPVGFSRSRSAEAPQPGQLIVVPSGSAPRSKKPPPLEMIEDGMPMKKSSSSSLGQKKASGRDKDATTTPSKSKSPMMKLMTAQGGHKDPKTLVLDTLMVFAEEDLEARNEPLLDLLNRTLTICKADQSFRIFLGDDLTYMAMLFAVVKQHIDCPRNSDNLWLETHELARISLEILTLLVYCPVRRITRLPNSDRMLAMNGAVKMICDIVGDAGQEVGIRKAAAQVMYGCCDVDEHAVIFLLESELKTAKNDVEWHGTTMGNQADDDDAEILLDKSILDIPPRASLTVKLNFQQLEPPRMKVLPRRGRRKKKNADSDSDNESVASSTYGARPLTLAAEQDLKGFHANISEESEDSEEDQGSVNGGNYESVYATLTRQPGRQLEELVDPEAEFGRKLQDSKDRMDEFLQRVPLFEVLTDRRDRDIMADEMRVRILCDGEELIKAGDRMSDHFFVLFRGELTRKLGGKDGADEEAAVLHPGSSVGEEALLAELPQPASVTAKGLCVVLEFAVDQLFFIRKKILAVQKVQEAEKLKTSKRAVPPKMGQLKSALSFRVEYKAKSTKSQSMKLFVEAVDKNGDGQIDLEELLSLMRKLGAEGSDEELLRVFGDMDVDESGHVDHEEFSAWWDSMNYFDVMGRFRYVDDVDGDWFDRTRVQKAWDSIASEKAKAKGGKDKGEQEEGKRKQLTERQQAFLDRMSTPRAHQMRSPGSGSPSGRRSKVSGLVGSPFGRRASSTVGTPFGRKSLSPDKSPLGRKSLSPDKSPLGQHFGSPKKALGNASKLSSGIESRKPSSPAKQAQAEARHSALKHSASDLGRTRSDGGYAFGNLGGGSAHTRMSVSRHPPGYASLSGAVDVHIQVPSPKSVDQSKPRQLRISVPAASTDLHSDAAPPPASARPTSGRLRWTARHQAALAVRASPMHRMRLDPGIKRDAPGELGIDAWRVAEGADDGADDSSGSGGTDIGLDLSGPPSGGQSPRSTGSDARDGGNADDVGGDSDVPSLAERRNYRRERRKSVVDSEQSEHLLHSNLMQGPMPLGVDPMYAKSSLASAVGDDSPSNLSVNINTLAGLGSFSPSSSPVVQAGGRGASATSALKSRRASLLGIGEDSSITQQLVAAQTKPPSRGRRQSVSGMDPEDFLPVSRDDDRE